MNATTPSKYHAALSLLRLAAGNTTSGLYRGKLECVVDGLQKRMLAFGALVLHRLVEEHRLAVLLEELDCGQDVYMTRSPHKEDPDDEHEGKDIALWTRKDDLKRVRKLVRERSEKVRSLVDDFVKLVRLAESVRDWLGPAVFAYEFHMNLLNDISTDQSSRERKAIDRDDSYRDSHFDKKTPPMPKKKPRPLFFNRPEADGWRLRQWGNIYKYGPDPGSLKPMRLDHESHAAATLLEYRMDRLASRSWEVWSRSVATDASGNQYPSFLRAAHDFLNACRIAIEEDAAAVVREMEEIQAAEGSPLQVAGAKKRKWKKGVKFDWEDWDRLRNTSEKTTFEERVNRKARKYKRDKRGRFVK